MSEISEHIMHMRVAHTEIDRPKAELEEANKWEISYYNIASDLLDWKEKAEEAERQLAEAMATVEKYECMDGLRQLRTEARQEAARTFLDLAEEYEGGKCELYDLVAKRFGLEG